MPCLEPVAGVAGLHVPPVFIKNKMSVIFRYFEKNHQHNEFMIHPFPLPLYTTPKSTYSYQKNLIPPKSSFTLPINKTSKSNPP